MKIFHRKGAGEEFKLEIQSRMSKIDKNSVTEIVDETIRCLITAPCSPISACYICIRALADAGGQENSSLEKL